MGKSTSCFKLITCGSDAADKDDHEASEIKGSNDKRGWSFRKRSARHRVLSNTVITETSCSANKEILECTTVNFQPQADINVEKIYTTHCSNEKPQLSSMSQISETVVSEIESKVDVNPPDSVVIIIQAAVRGFLAERALLKLKNVVKLQAAVRGHLVRRHAVGTLRCVQAIVKLQVLVRARHAQLSYPEKHPNQKHGNNDSSKNLGDKNYASKSNGTYTSIEKLLSNKFARQLLESTPKNKPIHVKGDPLKADTAWKWLERWTSVSSKETAELKEANSMTEQSDDSKDSTSVSHLETVVQSEVFCQSADSKPTAGGSVMPSEHEEKKVITSDTDNFNFQASHSTSSFVNDNFEHAEQSDDSKDSTSVSHLETVVQSEVFCQSADSKPTAGGSVMPSEHEEKKVITSDTDNFNFQASHSNSTFVNDNFEHAVPEKNIAFDAEVTSAEIDSLRSQQLESDASVPQELNSLPQKPEVDDEQPKQSITRFASDLLETEGKQFIYGSRKASNPAFIAAQSKFEELTSMANSGRSSSLLYQDATVESQADTCSVGTDTAFRSKEFSPENSAPYCSRIGGSECGTELLISSMLDSPDRFEVGAVENEREAKDLAEGISNPDNTTNEDVEANVPCSMIPASNLPVSDQPETIDDNNGKMVHSTVALDSKDPDINARKNVSDPQKEQAEVVLQDFRSSPEASPGSHMTVPESQGTPSSQVSMKPEKRKSDKNGSSNRRRSPSASNKSPANANYDSGSRGSREQLPKDQQSGKRRNSFGSVKPDHIDQEPRDNSGNNNSLPRFMQATESARAKINANNSPRSSPDVHDGEINVKKRHSLPGATDRQDSPRIQGSMSKAQQGTKGNGLNHERKWQR